MTTTPNRFDEVASATGSGVDVETIIETLSSSKSEFGDLDGDHPRSAGRDDIGTPTLEETTTYYDQHQSENIQIVERKEQ